MFEDGRPEPLMLSASKHERRVFQQPVRDEGGVALVEVVVSTVLFLVLAAALAAATVTTIKGNKASRDAATATALAQDLVEWFRAQDPVNLGPMFDSANNTASQTVNEFGETDPNGRFTRTWVATRNTPGLGMDQLTITVSWNGPEEHSITTVTFVCEHPTCT
jgi:Tfp pilus assembly protein PilV